MRFVTTHGRLLVGLLLTAATSSPRSEVFVDFDNRTPAGSARLVRMHRFDPELWDYAEVPVANGLDEGEAFVAQLFVLRGGEEEPVGTPANFRVSTSPARGTWVGGSRTIPRAIPGESLQLRVKAWDARAESVEAAEQCNLLHGMSAAFSYTPPFEVTSPDQLRMTNFTGFTLGRKRYAPHAVIGVDENGVTAVGGPDLFHPEGNATMTTEEWHGLLRSADWGASGAVVVRGNGLEYQAPPNRYGEWIVNGRQCDECGHCASGPLVKVSIRPSPRRPYLAFVDKGGSFDLVLRGIAGRYFRVERSSNLRTWAEDINLLAGDWGELVVEPGAVQRNAGWFRLVEAH